MRKKMRKTMRKILRKDTDENAEEDNEEDTKKDTEEDLRMFVVLQVRHDLKDPSLTRRVLVSWSLVLLVSGSPGLWFSWSLRLLVSGSLVLRVSEAPDLSGSWSLGLLVFFSWLCVLFPCFFGPFLCSRNTRLFRCIFFRSVLFLLLLFVVIIYPSFLSMFSHFFISALTSSLSSSSDLLWHLFFLV